MTVLTRAGAAGAVLAAALLAGCSTGTPAPSSVPVPTLDTSPTATTPPSATAAPTAEPAPQASPAPGPRTPAPQAGVALPWPAPTPAEVTQLQSAVDGGAQPWLLDPEEVAISYVATAHGWSGADPSTKPGGSATGTTVEVRASDGQHSTLTLTQPGKTGHGGIWVVTAEG